MNSVKRYSGTKTNFLPKYPMMWFPLHGDTVGNDEATAIVDQAETSILATGKLDLTGTTAAIWSAVPGVMSNPASDVNTVSTEQTLLDFLDLSTITTGGILILFNAYMTGYGVTTEELIIDASSNANSGGWAINFAITSGFLFVTMKPAGSSLVNISRSAGSPALNTTNSYAVYLDITHNTAVIIQEKIEQVVLREFTVLPTVDPVKGVSFFSRTDQLKNVQSTTRLSNMQIYRVNDDVVGLLPTIAAQYKASPNDIPMELRS